MTDNKAIILFFAIAGALIGIIAISIAAVNVAEHMYLPQKETIIHICEGDTTNVEKINNHE